MPWSILIRLLILRTGIVLIIGLVIVSGLFAVDYFLGTNVIAVIWQWMARLWQVALRWLQLSGKFLLRLVPGFLKRFMLRKGMSGFWRLLTTGVLAFSFAWLGGERYKKVTRVLNSLKVQTVHFLQLMWNTEIWLFPKWMRALVFIAALVLVVVGFVKVQEWATSRNSPTILGIDSWSMTFGFVASFFLTKLPLIGFDHFVSFIFRPMQNNFRRMVRRSGGVYILLNWALAFRPLRRRAELERIQYMRKWRETKKIDNQDTTAEQLKEQV